VCLRNTSATDAASLYQQLAAPCVGTDAKVLGMLAGGAFVSGHPLQLLPALEQLLLHLQDDDGGSRPPLRMKIFSVEYPLCPPAVSPAALDAAAAAYVWAAASSDGLAAKHIFLGACYGTCWVRAWPLACGWSSRHPPSLRGVGEAAL
jgi:hypothetical protein